MNVFTKWKHTHSPQEQTYGYQRGKVGDGINSGSSVTQSLRLFATPWTAAHEASLSITNSRSLLRLMSIKSVMPSNHLILCHPLLLLPSIFPSTGSFPMSLFFSFLFFFANVYSTFIHSSQKVENVYQWMDFKKAIKNEILISIATWMNIKDIMQSDKKSDTNLHRK